MRSIFWNFVLLLTFNTAGILAQVGLVVDREGEQEPSSSELSSLSFAVDNSNEDGNNDDRRLRPTYCRKKHEKCFPFFYTCCAGMSCEPLEMICYNHPRSKNEPCVPYAYDCEDGYTCDMATRMCRDQGSEEGDACYFSRPCDSNSGLYCDETKGECAYPSEAGGRCSPSSFPCQAGLYCKNEICRVPGQAGDICNVDSVDNAETIPCSSGFECTSEKKCAFPQLEDEACNDTTDPCSSSLHCVAGVCMTPAVEGHICSAKRPCQLGLICNNYFCEPMPPFRICDMATGDCDTTEAETTRSGTKEEEEEAEEEEENSDP